MKTQEMTSSQDTEQDVNPKPLLEDQREEMADNSQRISTTNTEDTKDNIQEKAMELISNACAFLSEIELLAKNLRKEISNHNPLQRDSSLNRSESTIKPKRSTKVVPMPSRATGSKEKNACSKSSRDIAKTVSSSRMNSKVIAYNKRRRKTLPRPPRGGRKSVGFDTSNSEPLNDAKTTEVKASQKLALDPAHMEEKKQEDSRTPGPFFYIGGKNGAHLVNNYCKSKGWQQLEDRKRDDYKLKWCESKCAATYYCFKAGEQLLYQIPNNKVLTTKIGLLTSLREYERVMNKVYQLHHHPRLLRLDEFFPETFRLDMKDEKEAFFSLFEEGQTWICKPTSLNQGRGIFLLKTQEQVDNLRVQLDNKEEDLLNRKFPFKLPQARIVQRYIQNPLLLEGRKFDVRSYLLIACTVPYVVFFRHGYVRLTCNNYDPNSDDLTGHLTNQYMQKKHPQYKELKEETVWSMERFSTYVNEKFVATKGLPRNWVSTVFTKRMQQIMMQCFLAVKSKLECKLGYFDLIGCDFLIDEEFKVWVLEMNSNPALHTNCQVLKNIIPSVVNETLDLSLEIFHKCLKGQRVLPLETQRSFVLLYNGDFPDQSLKFTRVKPSVTASKIQRSSKPEGDTEQMQKAPKGLEKPPKTAVTSTKNSSGTKPTLNKFLQKHILSLPYVKLYEISRASSAKLKGRNEPPVSSPGVTKQKALTEEPNVAELYKDKGCHAVTVPLLIEQVIPIPQHLRMLGNKSLSTRKSHNAPSILTTQDLSLQLQSKISGGKSSSQPSANQHSIAKIQCHVGGMVPAHEEAACAADCLSANAATAEDMELVPHCVLSPQSS